MNIKRPSLIFLISAIVGIVLAYSKMWVVDKAIFLSMTFLLLMFLIYKKKIHPLILVVCIVVTYLYAARYQNVCKKYDKFDNYIENNIGKKSEMQGIVTNIGKSTNSSYIELSNFTHLGKNIGKIKCYYNPIDIVLDFKIGYKVSVNGKMYRYEKASNVGQFDNQNYYRSLGFSGSMYANAINVIDNRYDKFMNWLYDAKCIIKAQVEKIFIGKSAGLFNCMITGDRSGLDKIQKKLFNENGIAHILAISGLHLSILGLGLFELLRKKLKLRTSALIVSAFILLYGLFIDCSVTSLRAIIMLYIRFLSLGIGRTYDSKNTLYILAVIFLMINPYNLFNVGFQFSYMAILSLNMDVRINKIKIPSVLVLTLFLLPITIYNYFTYPLYSILLNLIVIPLMSIVLFFGLMGVGCSFIYLPLGKFFVGIVHMIFVLYEELCLLIEKLPYHKILMGKPSLTSIIIFYTILFGAYFFYRYLINKKGDEDEEKKVLNIICRILPILFIFMSIFVMIYKPQNGLKISCLSIGQGDSFIIRTQDKKVYTIDGGSTSNTSNGQYILSPNMKANQISVIEKAYISHIDADHTNAIQYIIENEEDIEVKEVVLPIIAKDNKEYVYLKNACEKNNVKISYLKRGDRDNISNNLYFDCFSPSDNMNDKLNLDVNQASMCLKLNYIDKNNHTNTMLFTGDMGRDMEKELMKDKNILNNLSSDILKVAHHGSRTSSSKKFVEKVQPKYAILSYGYKNSYHHPHKETINTLNSIEGLAIYNTVDSGEIDIYMNEGVKINTYFE